MIAPLQMLGQIGEKTFWTPEQASTFAADVDWLFYFIYWVSVFFFLLITGLTVLFMFKFRRRKEGEAVAGEHLPHHNMTMEITWTIIPLILVMMMFVYGFQGFMNISTPPDQAEEIVVEAKQWSWTFIYSSGKKSSELYIPKDYPVRLVLSSTDVLHSLYIPAFRAKQDVVPGRYNKMWFEATKLSPEAGFHLFCTEYCGTLHADMITRVHVLDKAKYATWKTDITIPPPSEHGKQLWQMNCAACHTIEEPPSSLAPTWRNLYMSQRDVIGGPPVLADEDYIRESIVNPQAKVVSGYPANMPSFQGSLSQSEINSILAFMKTISDNTPQNELDEVRALDEEAALKNAEEESTDADAEAEGQ